MKGKEISIETWLEIREEYLQGRATLAELALKYGVGKSTLMNKASAEGWTALKKGEVVQKPSADADSVDSAELEPNPKFKQNLNFGNIIDDTIKTLIERLPEARVGSQESIATALCKLIEVKQKICPPTAGDLAERAIELGIGPEEFLAELRRQWHIRNRV